MLDSVDEASQRQASVWRAYRSVFMSDQGKSVLEDMLYELYFLRPCENEGQQALCNYAKSLLSTIYGPMIDSGKLESIIQSAAKKTKRKGFFNWIRRWL